MHTHLLLGLAASLAALAAVAQTAPSETAPPVARTPPVVSDVGPAPAEERDSAGAIVLDRSPLRPLPGSRARGDDTRAMGAGPAAPSQVRKGAKDRSGEQETLRRKGAGGLIEK